MKKQGAYVIVQVMNDDVELYFLLFLHINI
jgi:hypothetical protein